MTKEDTVTSSSVPPSSPAIVDGVIPFNCLRLSQQSSSVDDDDSDNFFHHKFQEAENKLHHSYNDYSLACSFRRICSVEPNREQRSLFSSYIDNSTVDFSLSKNNNKDSVLVKKMMVDYSLSHMETNWLGKKALYLNNLKLCEEEIPISYIENLKQSLEKLSLSGNRLGIVPLELVESLSSLKTLDLSHCLLRGLPSRWNLPKLVHLNLSHNRLLDFPEQVSHGTGEALTAISDEFHAHLIICRLFSFYSNYSPCSKACRTCKNSISIVTKFLKFASRRSSCVWRN